ncbi:MAG: hypothetical protein KDD61_04610 [Bdellovibrionales bacterium]|nr:hypothetical protein [Bdellovibrionales bacterium]
MKLFAVILVCSFLLFRPLAYANSQCDRSLFPKIFQNIQFNSCLSSADWSDCFQGNLIPASAIYIVTGGTYSYLQVLRSVPQSTTNVNLLKIGIELDKLKVALFKKYGPEWYKMVESSSALYAVTGEKAFKNAALDTLRRMGADSAKIEKLLSQIGKSAAVERGLIWTGRGLALIGGSLGTAILFGLSPSDVDCSSEIISQYFEHDSSCQPTHQIGPNAFKLFSLPEAERNKLMDAYPSLCTIYEKIGQKLESNIKEILQLEKPHLQCQTDSSFQFAFTRDGQDHSQKYSFFPNGKIKSIVTRRSDLDRDVTLEFSDTGRGKTSLDRIKFKGNATGLPVSILLKYASENYLGNQKYIEAGLQEIPIVQLYGPLAKSCCSSGRGCEGLVSAARDSESPSKRQPSDR